MARLSRSAIPNSQAERESSHWRCPQKTRSPSGMGQCSAIADLPARKMAIEVSRRGLRSIEDDGVASEPVKMRRSTAIRLCREKTLADLLSVRHRCGLRRIGRRLETPTSAGSRRGDPVDRPMHHGA